MSPADMAHKLAADAPQHGEDVARRLRDLDEVLSAVQDYVYVLDSDGRFVFANRRLLNLWGLTSEQAVGRTMHELDYPPEVEAALLDGVRQVCRSGQTVTNITHYTSPSGARGTFENVLAPILGPDGKVAYVTGSSRDVTERVEAAQALTEAHLRTQRVLDSVAEGYYVLDRHWRFVDMNPAAERHFGRSAAELVGKDIWRETGVPPESLLHRKFHEAVATARPVQFEAESRVSPGRWSMLYLHPRPDGLEVYFHDITDRKRAETALRDSEQRYRTLFARMTEGFAIGEPLLDADGVARDFRFLETNEAFHRQSGLGPETLGRPITEALPQVEPYWIETYCRVALTGEPAELTAFNRDTGRYFQVFCYSPAPGRFAILFLDVTASRRTEEALRASEAQYRDLVQNANSAILRWRSDGTITFFNEYAQSFFGYAPEEILGRHISILMPGTGSTDADLRGLIQGIVTHPSRYVHNVSENVCRDGRRVWMAWTNRPILDAQGRVTEILAVGTDTTERKRAEDEQQAAIELLEMANAATSTRELARAAIGFFHRLSSCSAVGIRLQDGDDCPYVESRGMSDGFLRGENSLWTLDSAGQPAVDADGRPLVSCMCGNVICGRTDPTRPYFTQGGSFWVNSTTGFLAETADADRLTKTRNVCNQVGFESLALIPLRAGERTLGLVHLADPQPGRFSDEAIAHWERLAAQLAVALGKLQAEQALRQRAEEVERILEVVPAAVWVAHDPQCRTITGNRRANEFYEARGGENVSATTAPEVRRFLAPDGRELSPDELPMQVAAASNRAVRDAELHVQMPSGRRIVMLGHAVPLRDERGQARGCIGAFLDITERKQAEASLRRSLERFELLSQTASELLQSAEPEQAIHSLCRAVMARLDCHAFFNFLVDRDAGKLRLNACAGIPDEEAQRIRWLDYGVAVCGCAARDGCRIVAEHIPTTPDSRTELVKSYGITAYACHPLLGPGGEVIGTLSFGTRSRETFCDEDLSLMKAVADQVATAMGRVRVEQELRAAVHDLERSNRDLEQFAYVASHDLQEPLRMVSGFLGLLRDRYTANLSGKAQEYVRYAVDGADRMSMLIRDLLEYSRVGTRGGELCRVDTAAAARTALANCRASVEAAGAACEVGELPVVAGDAAQLAQLFQNLIGNAIKFRRQAIAPHVRIRAERQGGQWLFQVADNGIGIEPGQTERIFLVFQRLHTREQYEGTGIGLAICKKIVERHNGRIWAESTPGEGSTFCFTLPAID